MADPRRKPTKNKANTTNVRKAIINHIWLVVSSPLKNISQIGSSSQLLGKKENVPNHQPDILMVD
jgi:hypothetical protein